MQGSDQYKIIDQQDDINLFVIQHSVLVKRIANHLKCRLPANTDLDDLIQSGLVGLLEAKKRFSMEYNASFETYASIKIRGAMIDDFRKRSGMTREISQHIKKISHARSKIENNSSRQECRISSQDMANEIGVSLEKYEFMVNEINTHQSIHLEAPLEEDYMVAENTLNPLEYIEEEDLTNALKSLILNCSKREQYILALYYNDQLTFKEIADTLDLTEARVSQIHSTLLNKIKQQWTSARLE